MDMQFIQNMIANGNMTVAQRLLASGMNVNCLRTNATLLKDEWLVLDRAIIDVAQNRLRVYRDVIERGLVLALTNGLGKTVLESENVGDMRRAQVSMDGVTVGENDAVNYEVVGIPLPFIHKDYQISIRKLNASRNEGEALDTTQARLSTRKIAEEQELMLLNGFGITTATYTIYGYTNFPQRNTVTLTKNWDDGTKTGAEILADVLAMKQALIDAKFFGPYALYIPTAYETPLDEDFSTAKGSDTIRERILRVTSIDSVMVIDQMTANNVILVQLTEDVVRVIEGLPLTNVEWSSPGNMIFHFKIMTITVPQIRADQEGNSGIAHLAA